MSSYFYATDNSAYGSPLGSPLPGTTGSVYDGRYDPAPPIRSSSTVRSLNPSNRSIYDTGYPRFPPYEKLDDIAPIASPPPHSSSNSAYNYSQQHHQHHHQSHDYRDAISPIPSVSPVRDRSPLVNTAPVAHAHSSTPSTPTTPQAHQQPVPSHATVSSTSSTPAPHVPTSSAASTPSSAPPPPLAAPNSPQDYSTSTGLNSSSSHGGQDLHSASSPENTNDAGSPTSPDGGDSTGSQTKAESPDDKSGSSGGTVHPFYPWMKSQFGE
jgi:hypothetical protein